MAPGGGWGEFHPVGGPDIRRPHKIPVDCSPFAADKTPFVVACFFAKIAANGGLICFEAAASGNIQQDCRTYPPFIGADWRALDWHPFTHRSSPWLAV